MRYGSLKELFQVAKLSKSLKKDYPGCGLKSYKAGMKMFVRTNLKIGAITCFEIVSERTSDQKFKGVYVPLSEMFVDLV